MELLFLLACLFLVQRCFLWAFLVFVLGCSRLPGHGFEALESVGLQQQLSVGFLGVVGQV